MSAVPWLLAAFGCCEAKQPGPSHVLLRKEWLCALTNSCCLNVLQQRAAAARLAVQLLEGPLRSHRAALALP